jgi:nucleotide-binding universal stress UspA family protein
MYKKILVPLDGSELAECVLPHVKVIADGCGADEVVFVQAVEPVTLPSGIWTDGGEVFSEANAARTREGIDAKNKSDASEYLAGVVKRIELKDVNLRIELLKGKVAESLAEYATQNEFDLIVIATHGRSGISRWVWGSIADRLLHSACVPVLMVRAPGCVPGI